MLTALRPALRTPSAYRTSTETGTEALVPLMITMAGGPAVDRTSTGVHETVALTPASTSKVEEEPRGEPATGRCCYIGVQGRLDDSRWMRSDTSRVGTTYPVGIGRAYPPFIRLIT
jgi:hypothetical protein